MSERSGPPGRKEQRPRGTARPFVRYALTLAVLVVLVFALPRVVPGDPLASFESSGSLSPEQRGEIEAYYGLDRPLPEQFAHYLAGLARGDLGESVANLAPVRDLVLERLPWTLLLVGTALVLSTVASFVAGLTAAWRRGSFDDRFSLVVMTVVHAVPEFVLAILLLVGLGAVVPLFPVSGGATPFSNDWSLPAKLADVARHLVLPAVALTLGLMGTKFLLVRNTTISTLGQDYMLLARAKGLSERSLKYRHAGRNAVLPFLNVVGVQVGMAVGGTLFVERIFNYPGLASLMVPAIQGKDYALVEGCFLLLAVVALTANLVVDLVSARLDPRVAA